MPPVVEQGQKTFVQAAQRPDAENDVQHQESKCASGADDERLCRHLRVEQDFQRAEQNEVEADKSEQQLVVQFFVRRPVYRVVDDGHFLNDEL